MFYDAVIGGWDAIQNILSKPSYESQYAGSGFFPTPQRTKVISDFVAAAPTSGLAYRPIDPENPSMIETFAYAANQWAGSPYENQFGTASSKAVTSKKLADTIGSTQDVLGDLLSNITSGLDWAATQSYNIRTVADELKGIWDDPREIIRGIPAYGYPEGRDEQHLSSWPNRGAQMLEILKAGAGGIYEQVKGLFNLGYPQEGKQPTFGITHEIAPTKGTTMLIVGALIVVALIVFLGKKR